MSAIRDFFKKKKLDVKFSKAGGGYRLAEAKQSRQQAASSSGSTSASRGPPSHAGQRAGEAALRRIQEQQSQSARKPATLDNILQEERKKISEQYKVKEETEAQAQEQEQREQYYKDFDEKQFYKCPTARIQTPMPLNELNEEIARYIVNEYSDNPVLMTALTIKNCNNYSSIEAVNQCISTIEKILINLANASSKEELEKFGKVRKSKIEQKIISFNGGLEFLLSVGFILDENEEWLIYSDRAEDGSVVDVKSAMDLYLDILRNATKFPVDLDRQKQVYQPQQQSRIDELASDFYKLTVSDVSLQHRHLSEQRELEETLRTKAMREQPRNKKINSRFTRLRFKFQPSNVICEATFRSREKLSDVSTFILQETNLENFDLVYGTEVLGTHHFDKTLAELDMCPAAAIIIRAK